MPPEFIFLTTTFYFIFLVIFIIYAKTMPPLQLQDKQQRHIRPFVICLLSISHASFLSSVGPSPVQTFVSVTCIILCQAPSCPSAFVILFPSLSVFFLFFFSGSFLQITFKYHLLQQLTATIFVSDVSLLCALCTLCMPHHYRKCHIYEIAKVLVSFFMYW